MGWLTRRRLRYIIAIAVIAGLAGGGYYVYATWVPTKSLAVMPFVGGAGDDDKKKNATENLTLSILTQIVEANQAFEAKNPSPRFRLRVRPYTAVAHLKDSDPYRNGQILKVQLVLSGKIFADDKNPSVYMELMNVDTGALLWSKRYEITGGGKEINPELAKTISKDVWDYLEKNLGT